ncbi:MAG TPA: hypothetical protein PLW50_00175 [Smithellaceae bacterium]|nr:hypothetical protein [Smithellaceae bacterium]
MGTDKQNKKEQKFIADAFIRVLKEDQVTPDREESISKELKKILGDK